MAANPAPKYEPLQVAPGDLAPSAYHVRGESETSVGERFVESVTTVGVIESPIVRRENGTYCVLDGLRRVRAAREAGIDEIAVLCTDCSPADALALSLTANASFATKSVSHRDRRRALERAYEDPKAAFRTLGGTFEDRCQYCWRVIETPGALAMHEKHCDERLHNGVLIPANEDEDEDEDGGPDP